MIDADIISSVKQMRKLISTLDSLGFPMRLFYEDKEIGHLIPSEMPSKIINLASDLHILLQNVEKTQKYRDAAIKMCIRRED